jgi:non-lysosomal glucosylceramidase
MGTPTRRDFLKTTSLTTLSLTPLAAIIAGPFTAAEAKAAETPFIPADKKLDPAWVRSLFEKGATRVYRAEELATIGMPIGGIGAGQVYLTGDGRLAHFDIFNHTPDTGPGDKCYVTRSPEFPIGQGFTISAAGAKRRLERADFAGVTFAGEYPIGVVRYADDAFPLIVTMKAFSPFIPLNAADSGIPATVLQFTIENPTDRAIEAELTGHLENAIARFSKEAHVGKRVNRLREAGNAKWIAMAIEPDADSSSRPARPPVVFDDFESGKYEKWSIEGTAFGNAPAGGTIPPQQKVAEFSGHGLVNTFNQSDEATGRATSVDFVIDRPFINFLIGGGALAGKTCLNLVVDGKIIHTATGRNSERLEWRMFNVRPLIGKSAHLEIIDATGGPWGHINVDQIEFSDSPPTGTPDLAHERDAGTMALAVFSKDAHGEDKSASLDEKLIGELSHRMVIPAKGKHEVSFAVAWHFPNRPASGQFYATRFDDASAVVKYLAENLDRLARETQLWHDTYYDSTLPHWLLDRIHMPVSTLATGTTQWWKNGRYWAWEGVGCCEGMCTHVYNYSQAPAHLFPELERSARGLQDFGTGFHENGLVGFRGNDAYAADGQCGTILKAYREHLFSPDKSFLTRNYPRIKEAMIFLIYHDAEGEHPDFNNRELHPDADGIIEDPQHNTYDIWFHGPNTFVGSLYLAALRAMEEMADAMQDSEFLARCHQFFESGSKFTDATLFDGEYYFQKVDLTQHPQHQYDHGCLSDQLFGQNWANQLGLGYIYKKENIRSALRSIYKYNWTPDVGAYNLAHPPQRWFARVGEAGLITCTFPKSPYLKNGVLYREEVWTGIEYQVASHMIAEGMIDEALTIIRGIHDRYDAKKHNPWNEIECGDHYARAMASWGCLTALSGFQYDGPAQAISFNPKITPENFRCAFTSAQAWGTYAQNKSQVTLKAKYGALPLKTLSVPLAEGTLFVNGQRINAKNSASGALSTYTFDSLILHRDDELTLIGRAL